MGHKEQGISREQKFSKNRSGKSRKGGITPAFERVFTGDSESRYLEG